jgi:hypothetical protein
MVRRRVRDQQERLALSLHVVIDPEPLYLDLRHARLLLAAVNTPSDDKIIATHRLTRQLAIHDRPDRQAAARADRRRGSVLRHSTDTLAVRPRVAA